MIDAGSAGSVLVRAVAAATMALSLGAERAHCEDQVEPAQRDAAELQETSRLIQAELPQWNIVVGPNDAALRLEPHPILRWTNPATGRIFGEIYVWTSGGRPEAVMSLYKAWQPAWGFTGEFLSLSRTKLVARRNRMVAWRSDDPGVELREVPDAPPPAENARQRLRQMRNLAAQFSFVLIDQRRNRNGERQALRLLSNPAYRYDAAGDAPFDGAIFAFVVGTDPEALLLLETERNSNGARWQYACARLNRDQLVAYHHDRQVWSVDRIEQIPADSPYFLLHLPETGQARRTRSAAE